MKIPLNQTTILNMRLFPLGLRERGQTDRTTGKALSRRVAVRGAGHRRNSGFPACAPPARRAEGEAMGDEGGLAGRVDGPAGRRKGGWCESRSREPPQAGRRPR